MQSRTRTLLLSCTLHIRKTRGEERPITVDHHQLSHCDPHKRWVQSETRPPFDANISRKRWRTIIIQLHHNTRVTTTRHQLQPHLHPRTAALSILLNIRFQLPRRRDRRRDMYGRPATPYRAWHHGILIQVIRLTAITPPSRITRRPRHHQGPSM